MLSNQLIFITFIFVVIAGCMDTNKHQAFGTLELDRIFLQTKISEDISEVYVAEGDIVNKGQILLCLNNNIQKNIVSAAKAEVKRSMYYLEQLKNGPRQEDITSAKAELEEVTAKIIYAEKEVFRAKALAEKNYIKIANLDTAVSIRDTLLANYKVAEAKLNKLQNGIRYEEIFQAEASYEKACADLIIAENRLDNYTIKATCNGRVDSLPKHTGEQAQIGTVVAIILAEGNPYARAYLPESMRSKVNIGSKLIVHVDGIKTSFQGTVRSLAINPEFTPYYALNQQERSRLVYLAEIQLTATSDLPIGIPVQVELP